MHAALEKTSTRALATMLRSKFRPKTYYDFRILSLKPFINVLEFNPYMQNIMINIMSNLDFC